MRRNAAPSPLKPRNIGAVYDTCDLRAIEELSALGPAHDLLIATVTVALTSPAAVTATGTFALVTLAGTVTARPDRLFGERILSLAADQTCGMTKFR